MSTEKCVRVAVIGESASGKSEFIRSFSNHPELIESVGEGQTTRSYTEYDFVVTQEDKPLVASIWLLSEKKFVRHRIEQVNSQLLTLDDSLDKSDEVSLSWIAEQIKEYKSDIDKTFLYRADFFDIKEFEFLNETIVREICDKFESMCQFIKESAEHNDTSMLPPTWMNAFNTKVSYFEERLDSSPEEDQEDKNSEDPQSKEAKFLERAYENFFIFVYRNIYPSIDDYLCKKFGQALREKDAPLSFNVTADNKDLLALFLKVVKDDDHRSKCSLSGMVSKIKVSGSIDKEYYDEIKNLGINSVLLVDTYGLDHEHSPGTEYLENRYQQIFNDDYPNLAAVLFVKKIHSSADTTFSNELKALYTVKPNLMTYVVGTHIDEQDKTLLKNHESWLLSKKKDSNYPAFSGKVMELIYDNDTIANGLKRNKVPESLAQNRLEVMRNRFAPFCGKKSSLIGSERDIMKKMNIASVSSVIASICDREHLGSGYINIDALCAHLNDTDLLLPFAKKFIENVTQQFQNLYCSAGPRTRWRVRVNLEEKKGLGYYGSVTDATWYRAFNDAYNRTFTKQIKIDTKYVTLSDKYSLQGNEKLVFDELMTSFFPYVFRMACRSEERLSPWHHVINCGKHPKCCEQNTCMWGMLLDCFYTSNFEKYNRSKHGCVIDWLNANHAFSKKCDDGFYFNWSHLFLQRMKEDFITLCRNHNLKVAAAKAKRSNEGFIETKETLYQEYKSFDSQIERQFFFNRINML